MHTEKANTVSVPSVEGEAAKRTTLKPNQGLGPFPVHGLPMPVINAISELERPLRDYLFVRLAHSRSRHYTQAETAKEFGITVAECEKREREAMKIVSRGLHNEIIQRIERTLDAPTSMPSSRRPMPPGPSRPVIDMPVVEPRRPLLTEPMPLTVSPQAHSVLMVANDGHAPEPKQPETPIPSEEPVNEALLDAIEEVVNEAFAKQVDTIKQVVDDAVSKHCAQPNEQPMLQMLEALAKTVTDMKDRLDKLAEDMWSAPARKEPEPQPEPPAAEALIEESKAAETPDLLIEVLTGIKEALKQNAEGFSELSHTMRQSFVGRENTAARPVPAPPKPRTAPKPAAKAKSVPRKTPAPPPPAPPPEPMRYQVGEDGTVKVGRKVYITTHSIGKEYANIKEWHIRRVLEKNVHDTILGTSRKGRDATLYSLIESRRALGQYLKTVVV